MVDKQLQKDFTMMVIDALQGTCNSSDTIVDWCLNYGTDKERERFGELTIDQIDHSLLDDHIFLCAQCGWWCEAGDWVDSNGEQICNDCNEENENDE